MRTLLTVVLLGFAVSSTQAQTIPPSSPSRGLEFGPMLGVSSSGFTESYAGESTYGSTGNRGHGVWGGAYARRPLLRSVHAELQLALEIKSDPGANVSIPFLQVPLVVEYLPFTPRRVGAYVRPVFIAGGSAGVRLGGSGGSSSWGVDRAGELAVILGLGVEAHSKSTGWMQLAVRVQAGRTDLSSAPGRVTSNLLVAYIKAHP